MSLFKKIKTVKAPTLFRLNLTLLLVFYFLPFYIIECGHAARSDQVDEFFKQQTGLAAQSCPPADRLVDALIKSKISASSYGRWSVQAVEEEEQNLRQLLKACQPAERYKFNPYIKRWRFFINSLRKTRRVKVSYFLQYFMYLDNLQKIEGADMIWLAAATVFIITTVALYFKTIRLIFFIWVLSAAGSTLLIAGRDGVEYTVWYYICSVFLSLTCLYWLFKDPFRPAKHS